MKRSRLEHEMKLLFGCTVPSYNKDKFYKHCKHEAVVHLELCTEEEFMEPQSFERWLNDMDWIEIKYDIYLDEYRYFRTDAPDGKSELYDKAMKIYNKAREPRSWFR